MRYRLLLGLAGAAFLTPPSFADRPDPFEGKVAALSHPRYAEREKAARDLEAAGEPALPALRAAATSADPELRDRAAAVADRIERAARSKKLLAAPRLAVKLDKVPLQQAILEVSKKTGLKFQLEPGKDTDLRRPVTVDTGEAPFWEAVAAFYAAAGLVENDNPPKDVGAADGQPRRLVYTKRLVSGVVSGGERVIRLADGAGQPPAAIDRALRVKALPAGLGGNKYDAAAGEVTFHVAVDPAPGVDVREVFGVEVRRATADDRRALAPAYPPAAGGMFGLYQEQFMMARQVVIVNGNTIVVDDGTVGSDQQFPVTLKAGGTRPRQLTRLEGVVVARVVGPPEPLVTVADALDKGKGQVQTADGLSVEVRSVEAEKTGHTAVRVRLASSAEGINEVLNFPVQLKGRIRPFIRINRGGGMPGAPAPDIQLKDAAGSPLKVMAARVTDSTFDGTTMTQEVELRVVPPIGGLAGVTLTLTGRRPTVVEMPFTLKDVPLP